MGKQLIISVGREFGSGGHVIAEELARRFGLVLYDNNLLEQIAEEKEIPHDGLKNMTKSPKAGFFPERSGDIPIPCRRIWRICSLIT